MSLPRGQSFELRFPAFGLGTVFLYSQTASFSFSPHQEISSSSSLLRFPHPTRSVCALQERALVRCLIHIYWGLAFLYAERARGASQYEGNEKIRCGACNYRLGVGAQGHRKHLISSSEEISAIQHRLLSQPLILAFSTVGFGFILRLLSKALRGSQKPL